MQRNTPGQAPAGAPVFIAQGTADTTVRPDITKHFAEALCPQGVRVSFVLAQRRDPYLRRQATASAGARLDGRPLPRGAGAVGLRALASR